MRWLRECCLQAWAEVMSNSSNKIHQTWCTDFSRSLYVQSQHEEKRERRLSTLAAVWRQWHGKWRVTHPPHAAPTICEDHASPFCDGTPKEEGNGRRNQEKKEDIIQRIIGNDCPLYPVLESAKNMLPESSRLPLPANWPMHTT